MPQVAPSPQASGAVTGVAAERAELQALADAGYTRKQIAAAVDLPITVIDRILRRFGITTHGKRGGVKKPQVYVPPVHGTRGQKPPKLMPSTAAIRAASVFRMGA